MKRPSRQSPATLGWLAAAFLFTAAPAVHAGVLNFVEMMRDGIGGFDTLNGARGVTVSPDGKHVYAVADRDDAVNVFTRDPATSRLTLVQVLLDNLEGVNGINGARGVTISPDGAFAYIAGGVEDSVAVFARDSDSGRLTFVERVKDGVGGVNGLDGAASLVVSPDETNLYVAGAADKAVAVFTRNPVSGDLSFLEMHREGVGGVEGTDNARMVIISPDGRNVYSAGSGDDSVAVFRRDPSNGSLSFVEVQHDGAGGVDGLDGARGLAISPDGANVYVVGANDDKLAVFSRDPASGALTYLRMYEDDTNGINGLNGAWAVAVSADGSRVYTAANVDDAVAVFRRDPATGLLTFLEMNRDGLNGVDGLNAARAVAVSPDGRSIYACGFVDDALVTFHNNDPCGNGIVDPDEECDDGNRTAGDCCSPTCTLESAGAACGDDGNTCTDDRCDDRGTCTHPDNTASCDDGQFCTVNDACQAGVCQGAARDCSASGDQCNDGVCDETAGACIVRRHADGSTCDDGDACTRSDTCRAGVCTGTDPVLCGAADQCHTVGVCNPATGVCSSPAKANGTTCSDGSACTLSDTCQSGVCTGTAVVCTAKDQCHAAGSCNPSTGICSNPNRADGASCNDGNACTQSDTCQSGVCSGGTPVVCSAQDQCHNAGTCNPATGACSNPTKANGTLCNDGNACTRADTCQSGTCTGTNPVVCATPDQCHDAGVCNPGTGICSNPTKANGTSCSDGNACTQSDTCQAGTCSGTNPVVCTAQDSCHAPGTCNPSSGACSNPVRADGSACNDGNACTRADTCRTGVCTGADPVTCSAQDQCHTAGTCDPGTGTCSNPQKADGSTCNDANACTRSDTCQAGTCTGSNPVVCSAQDDCHTAGTCNPATGTCSQPQKADGSTCNDANACTLSDTCRAGTCAGTNAVVCAASDECHEAGTCNPGTGTCSNPAKADGASCDDRDACTTSDACRAGACSGTALVCTAQDPCHDAGTCDAATGLCSNPVRPDGASCSDSDGCTTGGTCSAGTCSGATMIDRDGDGVCDPRDLCPDMPDADQADLNNNGVGDACECTLPAPGRCLTGGGPKATDCLIEINPSGPTTLNAKRTQPLGKLSCKDGDTACDLDGAADGKCTFGVAVCLGNADPRLAKCAPADLQSFEVMAPNPERAKVTMDRDNATALERGLGTLGLEIRRHGRVLAAGTTKPSSGACSPLVRLSVPAPSGAKAVRRKIQLRGTAANRHKDSDRVVLECRGAAAH